MLSGPEESSVWHQTKSSDCGTPLCVWVVRAVGKPDGWLNTDKDWLHNMSDDVGSTVNAACSAALIPMSQNPPSGPLYLHILVLSTQT